MFEAVILAGGFSSRMGMNKMGLMIGNKPVISYVIESFYPSCDRIYLVGGAYFDEIKFLTKSYEKVHTVYNKNYQMGMFSSVLCGISQVEGSCFITPGDYPMLKAQTIKSMTESKGDFVVPVYDGLRGHPVLLNQETLKKLKKEPSDSNLKAFRNRQKISEIKVTDRGILRDLDTIDDYQKVKAIMEGV